MANSTDKWAKGRAVASFKAAIQNTKTNAQDQDGKGRTDNAQGAGKHGGQTIAQGDGFSANAGNSAAVQGAEKRGQAIHRQVTKGPSNER
jgi:hypothetical protein